MAGGQQLLAIGKVQELGSKASTAGSHRPAQFCEPGVCAAWQLWKSSCSLPGLLLAAYTTTVMS
jgi:hypothetical protein